MSADSLRNSSKVWRVTYRNRVVVSDLQLGDVSIDKDICAEAGLKSHRKYHKLRFYDIMYTIEMLDQRWDCSRV